MLLPVHAAIGGLIAERFTGTPFLALVFGFLSHFILDRVPHNDNVKINKQNEPALRLFVAGQIAASFLLMSFWLRWLGPRHAQAIILGMFGAILPDGLWGVYEQWKIKHLKWFYNLHNFFHAQYRISKKKALLGQVIIIIIASFFI